MTRNYKCEIKFYSQPLLVFFEYTYSNSTQDDPDYEEIIINSIMFEGTDIVSIINDINMIDDIIEKLYDNKTEWE